MDELSPPSCEICGALVPVALMTFHRDWHQHQIGQPTGLFEPAEVESEVSQLVEFVAALTAIPVVASRQDFVARLRSELMAEAFSIAIEPLRPAGEA